MLVLLFLVSISIIGLSTYLSWVEEESKRLRNLLNLQKEKEYIKRIKKIKLMIVANYLILILVLTLLFL